MKHYDRVCARIDLDAIVYNLTSMKKNLKPDTKIMGVIKSDGYGHGAVPIGWELEKIDYIYGYAVATAEEAMQLRREGLQKPILILGYIFPYHYEEMIRLNVSTAVFRYDMLEQLNEAAAKQKRKCKVHVKVDTGMGRIGISADDTGVAFVKKILTYENLELEGVFTHFATADEAEKSSAYEQLKCFNEFVKKCEEETGYHIPYVHSSNSAAIIDMPEANMDIVRAGIILYGLMPSAEVSTGKVDLKPVLTLESHITYVKEVEKGTKISYGGTYVAPQKRVIATVPVGYGDGYPRGLSNKGYVLIRGKKAPIVGRVCMDQFMVDVTDIEGCKENDTVILIGRDGEENITMEQLDALSGRFHYELACDLGKRVPKVFYKNNKPLYYMDYYRDIRIEKE